MARHGISDDVEVDFFHGDADDMVSAEHADRILQVAPHGQKHLLSEGSHMRILFRDDVRETVAASCVKAADRRALTRFEHPQGGENVDC